MSIKGWGLTTYQALFVRVLRYRYSFSYKEVDTLFNRRYIEGIPFKGSAVKGNRTRGRHLCKLSDIILS